MGSRVTWRRFGASMVVVAALAACGSSGSKKAASASSQSSLAASGDKTAFCKANADITGLEVTFGASSDQMIEGLSANQSLFATFLRTAPPEIRTDAQTVVDAVNKTVATKNATPLGEPNLQSAVARINTFCGQTPGG